LAVKKAFIFSEIEDYRNKLEIKHVRSKNHFVLGIILFMMILTLVYMLVAGYSFSETIPLMVGFLLVLIFNIAHLAYGTTYQEFFTLNKYVTTLGLFALSIGMIFTFKSPSMIISLFIAYSISAFYQDLKVLLLSNIVMLFTVFMIIFNYPAFLILQNASIESNIGIVMFFVAFMMILSLSSFVIVKQKSFFFNQIASSKESEFRNIDLLIDLKNKVNETTFSSEIYFDALSEFLEAFCVKIESPNIFTDKIEIMKCIDKGEKDEEILGKFPSYSKDDLSRLEDLLITNHHKLRKVAMKLAYMNKLDIKKHEIFSETQFKSFNHQSDSLEIKIIAFVLFYTVLKKGFAILPGLEESKIYDVMIHSDFYYYMDPRIIKIYQENSDVFNEIVKDAFKKKVQA
jgi:hypothetical protein